MGKSAKETIYLELLKAVVKFELSEAFLPTLKAASPLFDVALVNSYLRLKSQGVGEISFLKGHMLLTSLILPHDDVKAIVACNGNWKTVQAQIARLRSSSKFGSLIMQTPYEAVKHELIKDEINMEIGEIRDAGFAPQSIHTARTYLEARWEHVGPLAACKRNIALDVLSMAGVLRVCDRSNEFKARLEAEVKRGILGMMGGPTLLPHEIFVMGEVEVARRKALQSKVLFFCQRQREIERERDK